MRGEHVLDEERVTKISIVPRLGSALGFTQNSPPEQERYLELPSDLRGHLAKLMGGRCAEYIEFKDVSSGSADDLQKATHIAYMMVSALGMSERVGPRALVDQHNGEQLPSADPMREVASDEVSKLLSGASSASTDALSANASLLREMAARLQAEEKLEGAELDEMLARSIVPDTFRCWIAGDFAIPSPPPFLLCD
mmetsp:Transcript_25825/g.84975  ORF Transcript_25825/g.84975 Transcript_25825/m.84975 type:complete len:196 (+) Transcript_25825:575-1162(+)